MIAAFAGLFVIALALGFVLGSAAATKQRITEHLRSIGLTKDATKLYARAAKILRRLDGLTDLDGDLAADILTDATKKQVSEWLADYRKGLDLK